MASADGMGYLTDLFAAEGDDGLDRGDSGAECGTVHQVVHLQRGIITMAYQPPFTISSRAVWLVAEISALVERYVIRLEQHDALKLRRANRIKTIHSSLAIEGNTLSLKQVTDILDGKRVVAPLREIQEVKNAIATYDLAPTLNPLSVKDLLKAHRTMTAALDDGAGKFRTGA